MRRAQDFVMEKVSTRATIVRMTDTLQIVCPHDDAINRVPAVRIADRPKCGKCHLPLFPGTPVELSAARFERHLSDSAIPLLVDFWAEWCGPCKMMAPAFQQAAQLLETKMRFVKIDTESEPALAARYAIRSIPTLILFSQGRELARQSGAMTSPQSIVAWAESR